jgi:DNA-binding winged helix-turn-helix (wHTH) protein/tetratricopeptide (TPR) repeat protein
MTLSPLVEFAPFRLDVRDERLWRAQEARPLTPKAFAVLRCLVAHAGQLVTKATLMDTVWPETAISESTLTGCIWEVRQALGDSARHPHHLETVHGRGYRFIAPVTELAAPAAQLPAAVELPLAAPVPAVPVGCLVGREAELAHLAQWYETARQGQRQVALIGGEPGIGKSALVETFVAQVAATAPVWIAHGQCIDQYGAGEPYLPLLEALGRLCRGAEGDAIVAVLHQVAPSWLVHLPAVVSAGEREALARLARGSTPARMMRELAEALDVVTTTRPVLLVLEDVHWSDLPTLEWLHYVARRRDPARLLVIGTYRPVEVIVRTHPLQRVRAELRQLPQGKELVLDYLSETAVAAYLTHRFGAVPQMARLAHTLHQRTNGNPLFLLAVVDELLRRHILHQTDDAWGVAGGLEAIAEIIPESLHILIEQHVAHLSRDDQRLLDVASVAGVEFTAAAVAAGLAHAEERVEARCTALAQQGRFLQASGRAAWPDGTVTAGYRFRHALYQDIVYRRLPIGRQSRWHARIGTRLAQGFGEQAKEMAAVVAWHCVQGRLLPQAVPYLWQAGRQAVQRGAPQEAMAFYEQALGTLQQLPTTADRLAHAIDLHLALEEALFALGAFARVSDTLQAAARLAEQLEEPRRLGWVHEALSTSFRRRGAYDQAVAAAERARALATTVGDGALQAWAACRLGQATYCLGEYRRAMDCFREVITTPPTQTQEGGTWLVLPAHARSWLVYCLTQCGKFDEGLALGTEAVRLAESGAFPTSQCAAYASLAEAFLVRGAFPSAIALLERGLALCHRWHNLDWFPEYAASLGLAYAQGGRLAEALPLLEQAVAQEATMGGGHRAIGLTALSHGYLLAGRLEAAWTQAEKALSLACERQERGFQAWALRLLGEIAAHDTPPKIEPARAAYQQALALADELAMRPLQAHCHRSLGTLYAKTGQAEQARAALSTAMAMYQAMEMTFWLPETEAALAQLAGR